VQPLHFDRRPLHTHDAALGRSGWTLRCSRRAVVECVAARWTEIGRLMNDAQSPWGLRRVQCAAFHSHSMARPVELSPTFPPPAFNAERVEISLEQRNGIRLP
jgi:hypothetical protein